MSHPTWLTWAVLSAIFAALTTILAKLGLKTINADFGLMVRTAAALFAMVGLVWATGKWVPLERITAKTWIFLIFSGLVTGAAWYCYFRAIKIGEVSRVAAVDKFSVVMVAVFSAFALSERLGPTGWLGIVLVGIGGLLIGFGK